MSSINRFDFDGNWDPKGPWVTWVSVDKLQKEANDNRKLYDDVCAQNDKVRAQLQDMTAKAMAAVWLLATDTPTPSELTDVYLEAQKALSGEDKKRIEELHAEIGRLQEYIRRMERPPVPGVNAVYGVHSGDDKKIRYALMLTAVHHGPNGGLEIEVMLP